MPQKTLVKWPKYGSQATVKRSQLRASLRLFFTISLNQSLFQIVQSSAVDFLHLLLVAMNWLCHEYEIDARFVISIHDEVRYLCPDEEAPRVALALMLAHLYVRTFISHRVGFRQLPSVSFCPKIVKIDFSLSPSSPRSTATQFCAKKSRPSASIRTASRFRPVSIGTLRK